MYKFIENCKNKHLTLKNIEKINIDDIFRCDNMGR